MKVPVSSKHEAKPFLKWAGGKGQLIDQIRKFLPSEIIQTKKIDKYFEPFLGGGAVFFWLSNEYEIKRSFLYDINPEIIIAYRIIRDKASVLIKDLKKLQSAYLDLPATKREEFYYERRDEYNRIIGRNLKNHVIQRTAFLIFLNKTGFNGLFRVNSSGLFNVPFGRYQNPAICDEENLWAVHAKLQNAEIECQGFEQCVDKVDSRSLVYFDPPYRPISPTASFTGYIKNGFTDNDQRRLKNVCDVLTRRGAKVILSNSDPKNHNPNDHFFDDLFKGHYEIDRLTATRMINCNAERRGIIKEILVRNYALKD